MRPGRLLGDWWAFGVERRYGDGEAICDKVGLDYGTVRNCGAVANAYPQLSLRNDNLSFEHHRLAMAAPTAERQAWA